MEKNNSKLNEEIMKFVNEFKNPCLEIQLDTEPQRCMLGCEEVLTRKVLFEKTQKQWIAFNSMFKLDNGMAETLIKRQLAYYMYIQHSRGTI